jgi:hypothetical protein
MSPYFASAFTGYENYEDGELVYSDEMTQTGPEIPPECHNTRPVDGERCMSAVRAMCGDGR